MTPISQEILDDLWRLSPAKMAEYLTGGKFKRYPHIEFLDRKISRAIAKGNARLVISMPPRHGKSWLMSLFTPAWFLSLWPDRNVILASYEQTFAAGWGRQVRNFLQDKQGVVGVTLAEDSLASDRWHTQAGGGMVCAGVGGSITGRGASLLLCDDYCKNWEEAMSETMRKKTVDWFFSTFYTRAEPGASIIVLATRWHEDDLIGHLLSKKNELGESWEEIKLPALAEENDPLDRAFGEALCPWRYDVSALKEIKNSIGVRMFDSLYQQSPTSEEGNIVQRKWWRFYKEMPSAFDSICLSADLTFKGEARSDFVVIQAWGRKGANKYLLDQIRRRMTFTESIAAIQTMSAKWPMAQAKYIEDAANSAALIDTLKNKVSGLIAVKPVGSKLVRAQAVAPQIEAGNIWLPDPTTAPWVQDFIEEWAAFPTGRNDDQCDAASLGILKISEAAVFDWLPVSITRVSPWSRPGF